MKRNKLKFEIDDEIIKYYSYLYEFRFIKFIRVIFQNNERIVGSEKRGVIF